MSRSIFAPALLALAALLSSHARAIATLTGVLFVVLIVRVLRNVWRSIQLDRRAKVRISLLFAFMSLGPLRKLALYAVYGDG